MQIRSRNVVQDCVLLLLATVVLSAATRQSTDVVGSLPLSRHAHLGVEAVEWRSLNPLAERAADTVEVSGYYIRGDYTRLIPCEFFFDATGTPFELRVQDAWVNWDNVKPRRPKWPEVELDEEYRRIYFMRVVGVLEGPGTYGPHDLSMFKLDALEVLEVRATGDDDCGWDSILRITDRLAPRRPVGLLGPTAHRAKRAVEAWVPEWPSGVS
jgi:hypothetical protein